MKRNEEIRLADVRRVYGGPEGDLWELIMGEQIHLGGFASSMDLAERAGIGPGGNGVDLCCCSGAGMRFLVRFREVDSMKGVDATERVVKRGRFRTEEAGLSERVEFVLADVTESGLPDASADFVWGEDAWCYVEDKEKLLFEAARIVRPGGTIAFTDWIEGPAELDPAEAKRFLDFMKFPGVEDLESYRKLLCAAGTEVRFAGDTGRFPSCVDLYLEMIGKQLTWDALKILDFDADRLQAVGEEMNFLRRLAHDGKIAQGLFVAGKPES